MKNKIGILGSGIVAKTLGTGFLRHGYDVFMGTRHPEKLADWHTEQGGRAHIGSFSEAARNSDIVVLAVAGSAAEVVIEQTGLPALEGKTLIDVTNPITESPPVNGVLSFFTPMNDSLMEQLQRKYPGINLVKAFSHTGAATMVNPRYKGGVPTMFVCGNDDNAKDDVHYILDQFGWEMADMGRAEAARAIEPLCILWCIPGFRKNQWSHAFKLLKA
jgi:predicted dinucleotide-binding enzyme